MNTEEVIRKANRGLLFPKACSDEEDRAAVELIQGIASQIGGGNLAENQFRKACELLFHGFYTGRLELMAKGNAIQVLDRKYGEVKATINDSSLAGQPVRQYVKPSNEVLAKEVHDYMSFRAAREGFGHGLNVEFYEDALKKGSTGFFGVVVRNGAIVEDRQQPKLFKERLATSSHGFH